MVLCSFFGIIDEKQKNKYNGLCVHAQNQIKRVRTEGKLAHEDEKRRYQ